MWYLNLGSGRFVNLSYLGGFFLFRVGFGGFLFMLLILFWSGDGFSNLAILCCWFCDLPGFSVSGYGGLLYLGWYKLGFWYILLIRSLFIYGGFWRLVLFIVWFCLIMWWLIFNWLFLEIWCLHWVTVGCLCLITLVYYYFNSVVCYVC